MKIANGKYEEVSIAVLSEHPRNPNQGDIGAIHTSIEANGFYGAVVAQKSSGYILAGNHRYRAAKQAGASTIPVIWLDVDDRQATKILLADNRTAELAHRDEESLSKILQELAAEDDLLGTGYDGDDLDELLRSIHRGEMNQEKKEATGLLSERFLLPPFSILDSRAGNLAGKKKSMAIPWYSRRIGQGRGVSSLLFKKFNEEPVKRQDSSFCRCVYI